MKRKITLIFAIICLFLFGAINTVFAEDYSDLSAEELADKIAELQALLATQDSSLQSIEITVTINEKTRTGNYTGETVDGIPHGQGTFVSNDSLPLITYEGAWADGQLSGEGYIETESFLVHLYERTTGKFDKTGTYRGQVLDGLASGNGYFLTKNSQGTPWSYTGEWSDGTFNGYGVQEWHDESTQRFEGNFVNGDFTPTFGQLHASVLAPSDNYGISDSQVEFIDTNAKFFSQGKGISSSYINRNFELSKFKKNPSTYGNKLIKVEFLEIIQIFSYESYGRAFELALMEDEDGTIYYGYFDGKTSLDDSTRIKSIHLLPLDWATYENTAGQQIWAVFCAFTKSYEELDYIEVEAKASDVTLRDRYGNVIMYLKTGKPFYVTGYDSAAQMFTVTYDGQTGYIRGTGLDISKDELLKYFR